MSHLKLFQPDGQEFENLVHGDDNERIILSFKSRRRRLQSHRLTNVVDRARSIRDNQHCPRCDHPLVEPLELADGVLNRNNHPIPGTATLVGFHCHRCHCEWPA